MTLQEGMTEGRTYVKVEIATVQTTKLHTKEMLFFTIKTRYVSESGKQNQNYRISKLDLIAKVTYLE